MLGALVYRVNDNSAQPPRHAVVHCARELAQAYRGVSAG